MGLSNSKPNTNGIDYKKLRSRHLSKDEIRQNIKALLSNPNIGQFTDTDNTLSWITDTLNFNLSTSQTGGNSLSESENLKKLNNFIKNLENSEEVEDNFDLYKNEVMKLEKYINQNGGYEKFEGRPLNIVYSEYLSKLNKETNLKGGFDSEVSVSSMDFSSENKNSIATPAKGLKELYNEEINSLDKYIKQNGGYDVFEGRLLNIVNSNVLNKVTNYDENDTETEASLSSINMISEQAGGCPCDNKLFIKNNIKGGASINNTISATSVNSIQLNNKMNLSPTSNSSAISRQNGGANSISATSINSIQLNNNMNLSPTSNSSAISRQNGGANTISATSINSIQLNNKMNLSETSNSSAISNQNGGKKVLSLNTLSQTSLNSKINLNDLPRFSETSFSESVLNGGAREEKRGERKTRRRNESSSSSTPESSEDVDLEDSDESEEDTSSDDMNDEDTESSDDTVKMARMVARQRLVSESNRDSSSTTTEEESESEEVSDSDETSETSDADTSTESSDSRKMSRTKGKKQKKTKKISKKGKKSSKKMSRTVSENGLSESTEFRAVPFYSSENSTSFYRNYQNKNRFN